MQAGKQVDERLADWLADYSSLISRHASELERHLSKRVLPEQELGTLAAPWQSIANILVEQIRAENILSKRVKSEAEGPIREALNFPQVDDHLERLEEIDGPSFSENAPAIISRVQKLDENRLTALQDALTRLTTVEVDAKQAVIKASEQAMNAIISFEPSDEIQSYVAQIVSGVAPVAVPRKQQHEQNHGLHLPGTRKAGRSSSLRDDASQTSEKKKGASGIRARVGTLFGRRKTKHQSVDIDSASRASRESTPFVGPNQQRRAVTNPPDFGLRGSSPLREPQRSPVEDKDQTKAKPAPPPSRHPGVSHPTSFDAPALRPTPAQTSPTEDKNQAITEPPSETGIHTNSVSIQSESAKAGSFSQPETTRSSDARATEKNLPTQSDSVYQIPSSAQNSEDPFIRPQNDVHPRKLGQETPPLNVGGISPVSPLNKAGNGPSGVQTGYFDQSSAQKDTEDQERSDSLGAWAPRSNPRFPESGGASHRSQRVQSALFTDIPQASVESQNATELPPSTPSKPPNELFYTPAQQFTPQFQPIQAHYTGSESLDGSQVPELPEGQGLVLAGLEKVSAQFISGHLTHSQVNATVYGGTRGIPPGGPGSAILRGIGDADVIPHAETTIPIGQGLFQVDLTKLKSGVSPLFSYSTTHAGAVPVIFSPIWRIEEHQARLLLSYGLAESSPLNELELRDLVVVVSITGGTARSAQSKPMATFSKEKQRVTWRFQEPVILRRDRKERLLCQFSTESRARELPVDARFHTAPLPAAAVAWQVADGRGHWLPVPLAAATATESYLAE